jgi:hypothetical protein
MAEGRLKASEQLFEVSGLKQEENGVANPSFDGEFVPFKGV